MAIERYLDFDFFLLFQIQKFIITEKNILSDEKLVALDIFNSEFIPALDEKPSASNQQEAVTSPLLYVGIHNNQLYVQESTQMINRIDLDYKTGGNDLQSTSLM